MITKKRLNFLKGIVENISKIPNVNLGKGGKDGEFSKEDFELFKSFLYKDVVNEIIKKSGSLEEFERFKTFLNIDVINGIIKERGGTE